MTSCDGIDRFSEDTSEQRKVDVDSSVRESVYYLADTFSFFFFQAEDGIRDLTVTGVQTCALPISRLRDRTERGAPPFDELGEERPHRGAHERRELDPDGRRDPGPRERRAGRGHRVQIGRASCRERV